MDYFVNKSSNQLDIGQWIVERRHWRVDSGQWTINSGQWKVDSGQWTYSWPTYTAAHDNFSRGSVHLNCELFTKSLDNLQNLHLCLNQSEPRED